MVVRMLRRTGSPSFLAGCSHPSNRLSSEAFDIVGETTGMTRAMALPIGKGVVKLAPRDTESSVPAAEKCNLNSRNDSFGLVHPQSPHCRIFEQPV